MSHPYQYKNNTQHTDNDKFCPVFFLLMLLGIFSATNIKAYAYVGL